MPYRGLHLSVRCRVIATYHAVIVSFPPDLTSRNQVLLILKIFVPNMVDIL